MMWALQDNAPSIQGYPVQARSSVTRVTLREEHFRSGDTARKPIRTFRPLLECRPLIHGYTLETSLGRVQLCLLFLRARPLGWFAIVVGYHGNCLVFIHVGPHRSQFDGGVRGHLCHRNLA